MLIHEIEAIQTIMDDSDLLEIEDGLTGESKRVVLSTMKAAINSYENIYDYNNNYAILDDDGYKQIWITNGATGYTVTLPTLADNQNRTILIGKKDSGAGVLTVDGEGAETIDGCATIELPKEGNFITVVGLSTGWKIINEAIACQLVLNTYAGYGSTDTKIMRFTNKVEGYGNCFSENHTSGYGSNANGLNITINKAGKYAFSFSTALISVNNIGISKNSAELTTDIVSIAVDNRLAIEFVSDANAGAFVGIELYLSVGDIIRPHTAGIANSSYPARTHFIAIYLGK